MELLSCLRLCSELLLSHKTLEVFIQAILGMAISADVLSAHDAKTYWREMGTSRMHVKHEDGAFPQAGFVMDQDLSVEDRAAATGDPLSKRFQEAMVFHEYTNI